MTDESKPEESKLRPAYRDRILLCIDQGKKAVELALDVMAGINPVLFESEDYHRVLDEMVRNGEIIELEYIIPQMTDRVKSMYFPKGTKFVQTEKD